MLILVSIFCAGIAIGHFTAKGTEMYVIASLTCTMYMYICAYTALLQCIYTCICVRIQ